MVGPVDNPSGSEEGNLHPTSENFIGWSASKRIMPRFWVQIQYKTLSTKTCTSSYLTEWPCVEAMGSILDGRP